MSFCVPIRSLNVIPNNISLAERPWTTRGTEARNTFAESLQQALIGKIK
jgi:hypothetical protein